MCISVPFSNFFHEGGSFRDSIRPALSGGMDWWRMEWPFSRVRKIFFRGRNFQEKTGSSAERAILTKFEGPKFEIQSPKKCNSIPPIIPYPH